MEAIEAQLDLTEATPEACVFSDTLWNLAAMAVHRSFVDAGGRRVLVTPEFVSFALDLLTRVSTRHTDYFPPPCMPADLHTQDGRRLPWCQVVVLLLTEAALETSHAATPYLMDGAFQCTVHALFQLTLEDCAGLLLLQPSLFSADRVMLLYDQGMKRGPGLAKAIVDGRGLWERMLWVTRPGAASRLWAFPREPDALAALLADVLHVGAGVTCDAMASNLIIPLEELYVVATCRALLRLAPPDVGFAASATVHASGPFMGIADSVLEAALGEPVARARAARKDALGDDSLLGLVHRAFAPREAQHSEFRLTVPRDPGTQWVYAWTAVLVHLAKGPGEGPRRALVHDFCAKISRQDLGVLMHRVFASDLFYTGITVQAATTLHVACTRDPDQDFAKKVLLEAGLWMAEAEVLAHQQGLDGDVFRAQDYRTVVPYSLQGDLPEDLAPPTFVRLLACVDEARARAFMGPMGTVVAGTPRPDNGMLTVHMTPGVLDDVLAFTVKFMGRMSTCTRRTIQKLSARVAHVVTSAQPTTQLFLIARPAAAACSVLYPGLGFGDAHAFKSPLSSLRDAVRAHETGLTKDEVFAASRGFPRVPFPHAELADRIADKLQINQEPVSMLWSQHGLWQQYPWMSAYRYGYTGPMTGEGHPALSPDRCMDLFKSLTPRARRPVSTTSSVSVSPVPRGAPNVLGVGSYGCAFAPIMPCKDVPLPDRVLDAPHDFVSKLFYRGTKSKANALEEEGSNDLVARFDPLHEFTVDTVLTCAADLAGVPESALDECPLDEPSPPEGYYQLISENGGQEMKKAMVADPKHVPVLLQRMGPIIVKGLPRLAEAGMVHRDIKPANVLVNEARRRCTLIDFGLAVGMDQVFDDHAVNLLLHKYWYYPVEFPLYAYKEYIMDPRAEGDLLPLKTLPGLDRADRPMWRRVLEALCDECAAARHVLNRFTATNDADMQALATEWFANKVDVYSVGVSMLQAWLVPGPFPRDNAQQKLLLFIMALVHPVVLSRPCPFLAAQLWRGVYDKSVLVADYYQAITMVQEFEERVFFELDTAPLADLRADTYAALQETRHKDVRFDSSLDLVYKALTRPSP
jgi:hypothetical protein